MKKETSKQAFTYTGQTLNQIDSLHYRQHKIKRDSFKTKVDNGRNMVDTNTRNFKTFWF